MFSRIGFAALTVRKVKQKEGKGCCQKWDSNPRLQRRLRPERSALDRSAILTVRYYLFQMDNN